MFSEVEKVRVDQSEGQRQEEVTEGQEVVMVGQKEVIEEQGCQEAGVVVEAEEEDVVEVREYGLEEMMKNVLEDW